MEELVQRISDFAAQLDHEEKSTITIQKYLRDVQYFCSYVKDAQLSKEVVIAYKNFLMEKGYAATSVNSMLAAVNKFMRFLTLDQYCVKPLKIQRAIYAPKEKELTKQEYYHLLEAAKEKKNKRIYIILQTICSTGIRVSELKFFTMENLKKGQVMVRCKNKNRVVFIPQKLKRLLLSYAEKIGVHTGMIFVTRNGKAIDRSNIWTAMKALCRKAGISSKKVFPHNLRKLFARSFYQVEKDIAKLADVLGHANINTTRIYIITTGQEHIQKIEQLGLVI